MSTNWIDPNAIVGSGAVAKGSNFYLRNDIVEDILDKIKKGNSVLLAAPRRVGKTSIMQYMEQYPVENHKLIFQNIVTTHPPLIFNKNHCGKFYPYFVSASKEIATTRR